MTDAAAKEIHSFQTEVGQLLDIVAGSLYSNQEIFLRELISNASDACDKLRYEALTNPKLTADNPDFKIEIAIDKKAKSLSISDNGIGMNRDDLLATLGTIARSGTTSFLEGLKSAQSKTDDASASLGLIGQFGVGFYSAFMVADSVDVLTRKAGEDVAWLWSSDGKGEFSVEPAERGSRGTTVTLHLKKEAKEYLEDARIQHIVKTYSDHIGFPVTLGEDTLNAASALWTRAPKDISEEQHTEFYHHIAHAFDQPWMTLHNKVEGLVSYTNLLYIPSSPPFDLYEPERKSHVKLYVNRVFITEDAKGLMPAYLRFLRGVVDSEDLSLNVSREMLQTDPKLAKIRTGLSRKVISSLEKKATKDAQDFASFWENFGAVFKEGLVEDGPLREKILEVCRFSSTHGDALISLADYVERMKKGQEAIYYIAGDDAEKIIKSPHLEGFRAKGIEVLLLADPVDEFWLQHVTEFEAKPFKSITRGAADLDSITDEEKSDDKKDEPDLQALDGLIAAIKLELGDIVKDVRPSKRLTDSPVCLIADDGDMDVNLERILQRHGQLKTAMPRILELNPSHGIIVKLAERANRDGATGDELLKDSAYLLLDQARILDGEAPADLSEFGRRLNSVLNSAL